MATFYKLKYNSAERPDTTWLLANGVHFSSQPSDFYAHTRNNTTDVYLAMIDDGSAVSVLICSKIAASAELQRIGGFWTQVLSSHESSGFYYGTATRSDLNSILPTFSSLNDALAYFDVMINTPSVDVANLSGIFVGSTEIQKVILNGATIYQKAAAGFQVTIQQNPLSAPSAASDVLIYDGQSSVSGNLVGTIVYDDFLQHTYTITSGFIAICGIVLDSPGTASGGVAYVGETSSGEDGYYYAVTGDGTVTDFAFICLTGDALVAMADGTQKRLDEIEIGDSVLSLDWETKDLIARKVIFTDKDENKSFTEFDRWIFADGTEIKTVHRHEFYNVEKGGMAYMDTWEIGDRAYRIDGSKIALVGHENVKETVKHYKITLEGDTNYFVHGLLNGDRNCPKEKL